MELRLATQADTGTRRRYMKEIVPINTTIEGCAYAIKHSYNKNFAISTATNGGGISLAPQSKKSILMNAKNYPNGYGDVAPTICADYYKAATSHFIRYTNGFAYPAVMEIYEECSTAKSDA